MSKSKTTKLPPPHTPSPAAKALRRCVERSGRTDADAAKEMKMSPPALHALLSGQQRPRAVLRRVIERWTKGEVAALDWDTTEERKLVASVVPFDNKSSTGTDGR